MGSPRGGGLRPGQRVLAARPGLLAARQHRYPSPAGDHRGVGDGRLVTAVLTPFPRLGSVDMKPRHGALRRREAEVRAPLVQRARPARARPARRALRRAPRRILALLADAVRRGHRGAAAVPLLLHGAAAATEADHPQLHRRRVAGAPLPPAPAPDPLPPQPRLAPPPSRPPAGRTAARARPLFSSVGSP